MIFQFETIKGMHAIPYLKRKTFIRKLCISLLLSFLLINSFNIIDKLTNYYISKDIIQAINDVKQSPRLSHIDVSNTFIIHFPFVNKEYNLISIFNNNKVNQNEYFKWNYSDLSEYVYRIIIKKIPISIFITLPHILHKIYVFLSEFKSKKILEKKRDYIQNFFGWFFYTVISFILLFIFLDYMEAAILDRISIGLNTCNAMITPENMNCYHEKNYTLNQVLQLVDSDIHRISQDEYVYLSFIAKKTSFFIIYQFFNIMIKGLSLNILCFVNNIIGLTDFTDLFLLYELPTLFLKEISIKSLYNFKYNIIFITIFSIFYLLYRFESLIINYFNKYISGKKIELFYNNENNKPIIVPIDYFSICGKNDYIQSIASLMYFMNFIIGGSLTLIFMIIVFLVEIILLLSDIDLINIIYGTQHLFERKLIFDTETKTFINKSNYDGVLLTKTTLFKLIIKLYLYTKFFTVLGQFPLYIDDSNIKNQQNIVLGQLFTRVYNIFSSLINWKYIIDVFSLTFINKKQKSNSIFSS